MLILTDQPSATAHVAGPRAADLHRIPAPVANRNHGAICWHRTGTSAIPMVETVETAFKPYHQRPKENLP